jgi:hypothetical protein
MNKRFAKAIAIVFLLTLLIGILLRIDSDLTAETDAWEQELASMNIDAAVLAWFVGSGYQGGDSAGAKLLAALNDNDKQAISDLNAEKLPRISSEYYIQGSEESLIRYLKTYAVKARGKLAQVVSRGNLQGHSYRRLLKDGAPRSYGLLPPEVLEHTWGQFAVGAKQRQLVALKDIYLGDPDLAMELFVADFAKLFSLYNDADSFVAKKYLQQMIASDMEAMSQWYRYRLLRKPVQLPELAFNPWHKAVVSEYRWISQHIGNGNLLRQTARQSGRAEWLGAYLLKPNMTKNRIQKGLAQLERLSYLPAEELLAEMSTGSSDVGLVEKIRNPASVTLDGLYSPLAGFIRRQHYLAGRYLLTQAYIDATAAGKRVENLVNAPFDPLVPSANPEYDPKERNYCFASAKQEGSQWCLKVSRPMVVSQPSYSGSSQ